ncbi:MAG: tRNA pseudouridine(55) synthase TruB [Lachnospirales bacterium]
MKKEIFNGIINVYKEKDYTSHDVVAIVRKTLSSVTGEKAKVGHTGTLDPNATGVLPICVGRGTKFVDMILNSYKVYKCELVLGYETDTLDVTGKVIKKTDKILSKSEIECVINSFVGEYEQVPPMYSAIKINGQKMYDLARKGEVVDIKPRLVEIYSIDIHRIDEENRKAFFTVKCKKGTYIRSLCRDIGDKLGVYGTMGDLERLETSGFTKENAIFLKDLKNATTVEELNKNIVSVENILQNYDSAFVDVSAKKAIVNGNKIDKKFITSKDYINGKIYKMYLENSLGKFIGLYLYKDSVFIPEILYDIEV